MAETALTESPRRTASFTWVMVIGAMGLIAIPVLLYRVVGSGGAEEFFGQKLNPSMSAYDFHLTDHTGKPLRLSDLMGKVSTPFLRIYTLPGYLSDNALQFGERL